MSDSTQDDARVQSLGLLVSPIIVLIPGLVIHSFIICVNVNDWWKGRSLASIDHIVISLGISRMGTQCFTNLEVLLSTFFMSSQDSIVSGVIIDTVYTFFTYTNIWLTTLLSIVFCLKISNLRTGLFLYLKRVIDHRTGHLIAASGLVSLLICLISLLMVLIEVTNRRLHNTTLDNILISLRLNIYLNCSIGASVPLLFFYISSVLLFASLYHHTVKMKMSSNSSINLETYYSAMKFVFFTFMYNNIYLSGLFTGALYYYFYFNNLPWVHITFGFLPVIHSSYLIYRISKLRIQMFKLYQNVIDLLL